MSHQAASAVITVRSASSADRAALEQLVAGASTGTAYEDVPRYFLRLALAGRSDESRAIVAERDGTVVGCALFGAVAGSLGTGRLHFVAVAEPERRLGAGRALCEAVVADLASRHARSVIVELPDEPTFTPSRHLFARCGFAQVASVADYYRDGVALVVLNNAIVPRE